MTDSLNDLRRHYRRLLEGSAYDESKHRRNRRGEWADKPGVGTGWNIPKAVGPTSADQLLIARIADAVSLHQEENPLFEVSSGLTGNSTREKRLVRIVADVRKGNWSKVTPGDLNLLFMSAQGADDDGWLVYRGDGPDDPDRDPNADAVDRLPELMTRLGHQSGKVKA